MPPLTILSRLAFAVAVAGLVTLALIPAEPALAQVNDKLQHFAGFFTLTILGLLAWRREGAWWLVLFLAALGGAIEIVQATPLIGRDGDVMDWLTDLAGIAAALLPALVLMRRR